jgi:hypothetical protein
MTKCKQAAPDDLHDLLNFQQIGMPEYSADLTTQQRLGKMIVDAIKCKNK